MPPSVVLLVTLFVPFVTSAAMPLIGRWAGRRAVGVAATAAALALTAAVASLLPRVMAGEEVRAAWKWVPSLGVELALTLDGFSLFFGLLVTGMGTLILLYASAYLAPAEDVGRFYACMLAFMGAMLGVVLSTNLATLYVFWELTSVTSFLLIGFWHRKEGARYGAQKALLMTGAGGLAMLVGFVLLYVEAGTFDLRELAVQAGEIRQSPRYALITLLVLTGAFSKSAQVPFHVWLPNAMEAPTPVSALLHSATMVKAGLFLVARMLGVLGGTELWSWAVTGVGLASLVWGAGLALRQTDLKALMANSTVSQLGLIMSLLGIGTPPAVAAAVFHTLNHALFKGALFLVTGIVEHETASRDIRRLRGLARTMPLTAKAAGLGALALAGVPPLNGFVSKEMFFEATLRLAEERGGLAWAVPALAILGSIFTLVYALFFFHGVFLVQDKGHAIAGAGETADVGETDGAGQERSMHQVPRGHGADGAHGHDPGWRMLGPPLALGILALALGLWPQPAAAALLTPATSAILGQWSPVKVSLWHGVTPALLMSGVVIGIGLLGYAMRSGWVPRLPVLPEALQVNTWYDRFVHHIPELAERLTRAHVTGRLADHLLFFTGAASLLGAWTLGRGWGVTLPVARLGPVEPVDVLLSAIMVAAALATLRVRSRLGMVAALGSVGMSMAALFVNLRAPDLALTQLIVESIALVLFVLAFAHLPGLSERRSAPWRRAVSAGVAVVFGALMASLTVLLSTNRPFSSIAPYFVETSLPLGGGRNVVNVILVDFRGLDTLGEITVLTIAALAVAALMGGYRRRSGLGSLVGGRPQAEAVEVAEQR